jgi:CRP-like cAMP-binding protein
LVAALNGATFGQLVASSPALRERLGQLVGQNQLHTQLQALTALDFPTLQAITQGVRAQAFQPGESIVRQGALGETFYLLLEGTAEVTARKADGTEAVIDWLAAGQFFGELALLGSGRRTATVRAAQEPVRVLELSRADFEQIIEQSPLFRQEVERLAAVRRHASDASAEAHP